MQLLAIGIRNVNYLIPNFKYTSRKAVFITSKVVDGRRWDGFPIDCIDYSTDFEVHWKRSMTEANGSLGYLEAVEHKPEAVKDLNSPTTSSPHHKAQASGDSVPKYS